ncbi:MAG: hypothetical protein KGL39_12715 [Patescibacteria group bacterium]|nr:hypothetical protein [Patescibacteria group bacterium]
MSHKSQPQYATPVAFPREVGEVAMARVNELQREVLRQAKRLHEKYGRNREGFLFASAVATSIAALSRDMAKIPQYGGERRVSLPEPTVDGIPRSEYIENLLADQAETHARTHRGQEPGDSAPPSRCNVCKHLAKLRLPIATDDEVGSQVVDAPAPTAPAVLIIKGEMDDVRSVLRAGSIPDGTRVAWYAASALDALRTADRNELHAILFGSP